MPSTVAYAVESVAVGWLVVGAPVVGRLRYRTLGAGPVDRLAFYRRTVVRQWVLTLGVLAVVVGAGVAPADLGLAGHLHEALALAPSVAELVGLTLVTVLVLRLQARRRPQRAWVHRLLRPVRALLPTTPRERRGFAAVAITAGITEEALYRGLVTLWVEQTWPSLGFGGAIVVSSAAFGLAHAYQGPAGVVLTGLAGYALAVVYGATASLLLPMLLHALIDLRILLVLPRTRPAAPALTSAFAAPPGPARAPTAGRPSTSDGSLSSP